MEPSIIADFFKQKIAPTPMAEISPAFLAFVRNFAMTVRVPLGGDAGVWT